MSSRRSASAGSQGVGFVFHQRGSFAGVGAAASFVGAGFFGILMASGYLKVVKLEKKEDMKARGLASPDCADALAFTFYAPVAFIDEQELEPEAYED